MMALFLGVFVGVLAVAVVTTVLAIARAREGSEDETGFHEEGQRSALAGAEKAAMAEGIPSGATLRVGLSAPSDAAAGLPGGLLGAR